MSVDKKNYADDKNYEINRIDATKTLSKNYFNLYKELTDKRNYADPGSRYNKGVIKLVDYLEKVHKGVY